MKGGMGLVAKRISVFLQIILVLALSSVNALAVEKPDAGKTEQQIRGLDMKLPSDLTPKVDVEDQENTSLEESKGPKIKVNQFRISGQTISFIAKSSC